MPSNNHPPTRVSSRPVPGLAMVLAAVLAVSTGWLQPAPALAQTPPAPLVQGLPDFTVLVDAVGPSVVNIRTVERVRQGRQGGGAAEEQMLEFFRRFGIPIPPGVTPRGP